MRNKHKKNEKNHIHVCTNCRSSTPYGTLPRGDVGRGVRLPLLYPPNYNGNGNQNMNGNTGNRGGGPGTPGTPSNWGGDGDDDRQSGDEDEEKNDKYVLVCTSYVLCIVYFLGTST